MKARPHYLFVTGNLACESLKDILRQHEFPFTYSVHNLRVNVASLMNTKIIQRRLTSTYAVDAVYLPGRFRGDLDVLSRHFGTPFRRGPNELRDLPEFFDRKSVKQSLRQHQIAVFAEITDAPLMSVDNILLEALNHIQQGADVIDLGFLPDTDFPHLEESIIALKENNIAVSVDTLEGKELLRATKSGADYLLSLSEKTLWVAAEGPAIPVLVPSHPKNIRGFYQTIEKMLQDSRKFIADPILEPVHCGFAESLVRYRNLRRRFADIEIMMGIGNITELTHADTAGMHAILLGIASELDIHFVLTTCVSGHCREVTTEIDRARRIMYAAKAGQSIPAHIDDGLMMLHERKPFPYADEEIDAAASQIRDKNYRIQVNKSGIHLYNNQLKSVKSDPFDFFPLLELDGSVGHAFYLGVELARAQIAWQLGKRYEQDEPLRWGCLPPLEQQDLHNFKEVSTTMTRVGRRNAVTSEK